MSVQSSELGLSINDIIKNYQGLTDTEILSRLKDGDNDAESAIYAIHQPACCAYIRKKLIKNGPFEPEDIFHNVILAFFNQMNNKNYKLPGTHTIHSYLIGICRNKTADYNNVNFKHLHFYENENPDDGYFEFENGNKFEHLKEKLLENLELALSYVRSGKKLTKEILNILKTERNKISFEYHDDKIIRTLEELLGFAFDRPKCFDLLFLFYFQKHGQKNRVKNIKNELNYASVDSVKTQKNKCLNALIERLNHINVSPKMQKDKDS